MVLLGKVFKSRYDLVSTSRTKPNKSNNYFLDITNSLLVKDMVSAEKELDKLKPRRSKNYKLK